MAIRPEGNTQLAVAKWPSIQVASNNLNGPTCLLHSCHLAATLCCGSGLITICIYLYIYMGMCTAYGISVCRSAIDGLAIGVRRKRHINHN